MQLQLNDPYLKTNNNLYDCRPYLKELQELMLEEALMKC